ncbi:trace amine-associated receptor 13c-like isoform X1 [Betta splendens]|uniref:Trace amine-associated receptor 13c-like isoform X1 n=1 Tax=Betta splendens TaxID=158456 RepID=A0A9W2XGL2_BETSP|nr:trace amine-associated receptor 13c-like isoform X1 [Betta splendens]
MVFMTERQFEAEPQPAHLPLQPVQSPPTGAGGHDGFDFRLLSSIFVHRSRVRQLHTPTNVLLLSLAVSDFLVGLVLLPGEIFRKTSCWFLGDLMCSLYKFVASLTISASIGDLILISAERYVAICDPLRYPTRVTVPRVRSCVLLCWFCSVLYSCVFVKSGVTEPDGDNSCYGECAIIVDFVTGSVDIVVSFILPVSAIVVLYMRVFVVAVSQARSMRSLVRAATLHGSVCVTAKRSELKAARTLGVLVLVFLICFCPYYCVSLAGGAVLNASYVIYLFYLNSCLNPVIYTLFYPWFRRAVKLIVTCRILQPGAVG